MTTTAERPSLMRIDDFAPFVDGLDHPEGVAVGPDGELYAGGEAGQIYRVALTATCGADRHAPAASSSASAWTPTAPSTPATTVYTRSCVSDPTATVERPTPAARRIVRCRPRTTRSSTPPATSTSPTRDGWNEHDGCLFRIRPGGETEVVGERARPLSRTAWRSTPTARSSTSCCRNMPGVVRVALARMARSAAPQTVVDLPRQCPRRAGLRRRGNLYIACYTPDVIYRLTAGRRTGRAGRGLGKRHLRHPDEHRLLRPRPPHCWSSPVSRAGT